MPQNRNWTMRPDQAGSRTASDYGRGGKIEGDTPWLRIVPALLALGFVVLVLWMGGTRWL